MENSWWSKCRNHPPHNSLAKCYKDHLNLSSLNVFCWHCLVWSLISLIASQKYIFLSLPSWSNFHQNTVMAPLEATWQSESLKLKDLFQVTVINKSHSYCLRIIFYIALFFKSCIIYNCYHVYTCTSGLMACKRPLEVLSLWEMVECYIFLSSLIFCMWFLAAQTWAGKCCREELYIMVRFCFASVWGL